MDGYGSGYGSSGYGVPGSGSGAGAGAGYDAEPSQQIMVRNVSDFDIIPCGQDYLQHISSLGLLQMKTLSSCSRLLGKLNSLKSFSMVLDPRDAVLSSLLRSKRRKQPLVTSLCFPLFRSHADSTA